MTRQALLVGFIALAFGLGSYRLQAEWSAFSILHIAVGLAAITLGIFRGLRGWRRVRAAARLETVWRAAGIVVLVCAGAVLAERLSERSGVIFDLTFEGKYEVAPATHEAMARLSAPVHFHLYHDPSDPRIRRTRILLEQIVRDHDAEVDVRLIDDYPAEEDRFGIGSSNTVIVQVGPRWERVERPTEGALFEAVSRLGRRGQANLYITIGTGEGDISHGGDTGFSGFAVALQTEGFEVRQLPSAVMSEIPEDADAVIVIGPARQMRNEALDALERYLDRGGNLVAFTDPGAGSGLETLLSDFGMASPDAVVVDPTSDPVDGGIAGLSPIAFNYASHPVTRGLGKNRNTVFRRSRAFTLHKPRPEDILKAVVFTSAYAWLHPGPLPAGLRQTPTRPADIAPGYESLVVTGRYERSGGEARIVAFGDTEVASNRYLRALYNLDLVMNAVHWAVDREDRITLRPKSSGLIQFPVPIANSMKAFYGVGLLIPEILLIAGGLVWLRQRQS